MPARRFLAWLAVLVTALLASTGFARTIEIVTADHLELRNVTAPGGETQQLIIITGAHVFLKIDQDELEATRVEYNRQQHRLLIVGTGTYRTPGQTMTGHDFTVDVDTQGFVGEDVFIATSSLDVTGSEVNSLPGQIDVNHGYFSPCGRCGDTPNAYAFRAERLTIYPGDRLVAFSVTLLLFDEPVAYLPAVVLFLNNPNRQPRLSVSTNDPTSGTTVELDLPFVTGKYGYGFDFLRYYQLRDPPVGFGVQYSAYDLLGFPNTTNAYFLALPPLNNPDGTPQNTGALFAYLLRSTGQVELTPGVPKGEGLTPLSFSVNLARTDSGIPSRELRGLTPGPDHRTDVDGRLSVASSLLALDLVGNAFIDNRGTASLDPAQVRAGLPYTPQFQPELRGRLLSAVTVGPLTLNRFSFGFGRITAPFDPLNRSARVQAGDSPYITAGRVTESHSLSVRQALWEGATLTASNDFTGQYYTTSNNIARPDGSATNENERAVSISLQAAVSQAFSTWGSLRVSYQFSLSEGESPFAFDRIARRPAAESITLDGSVQPLPWLGLTFSQRYNTRAILQAGDTHPYRFDPLTVNLNLTPAPLNASLSASYDLERGEPVSWTVSAANAVGTGTSFSARLGYDYVTTMERRQNPAAAPAFTDLVLGVGYRSPPDSRFTAALTLTDNVNTGEIRSWNLNSTSIIGAREAPLTLTVNQALTPPQFTNQLPSPAHPFARLNGSISAAWQGLRFSVSNNLDFTPFEPATPTSVPPSRLDLSLAGNFPGAPSFTLTYGGQVNPYGLVFYNPTLSGSLSVSSPSVDGNFSFTALAPSGTQPNFELTSATLTAGADLMPGVSANANVSYQRSRSLTAGGLQYQDSFTFSPFGVTIALARAGQVKPEVYITTELRGTYAFGSLNGQPAGDPTYTSPSGGSTTATFRPVVTFTFDRCCYAVQFVFDATPVGGASFRISFLLPGSGWQPIVTSDPATGIRFPLVPLTGPSVTPASTLGPRREEPPLDLIEPRAATPPGGPA
ncbi:MAG TPA: hypothetical protein VHN99_03590 [Deinococcales bacterium]|nr:hypothetical protein [Deinococcales bacterium]